MGEPRAEQALISDAELIRAIRSGDMAAYGELYLRHVTAARGLARQLVRGPAEVDDVVAEAFSKALDLMRRGGGPQDAFRPYLLTAVRRVAYDRHRGERKDVVTDEIEAFDPGQPFIDPAVAGLERSLIARAFLSLPERWRAVLWHTEIEGAKPAEVAPLLGLTANGVAALAYRAREGLRQAYLQMHLSGVALQECRPMAGKLGAFVRGGLSAREAKSVSDHLDGCRDCRAVHAELADVNVALRGVVAPIFLGPAAAAYVAAVAAKGSAAAWIAGKVLWLRHVPKQPAAMAGGVAAAATAVAVTLALTGHSMPARHGHHPAARPPAGSAPLAPPAPRRPAERVPPVTAPVQVHVSGTAPAFAPGNLLAAPVTLSTQVAPVGALLRGATGMLTFTVTNTGSQAVSGMSASLGLPPGVSLLGGGNLGTAAPAAVPAPGGWSCRATAAGAACAHGPLAPGQTTTSYLEVAVSPAAAYGMPVTISVSGGGRSVTATSASGVVALGLPARFAADGRLDTIVIGNALPGWAWWPFTGRPPSSSAQLALPGSVLWAGLYWSGAGYQPHPELDLRGPGGSFQAIGADEVGNADVYGYPVYQAYANVTAVVAAHGSGSWQAQIPPGTDDPLTGPGWTLVVVAADPGAPAGQAVVLDGVHAVTAVDPTFDVPLNGLLHAGADAGIQVVTWDGAGYSNQPALASQRQRLAAKPAVDLRAGYQPYLVGVVAATTAADSTQIGPPPYAGWLGNGGNGWPAGQESAEPDGANGGTPGGGIGGAAAGDAAGGGGGSEPSQDHPLPGGVEPDPCTLCTLVQGLGLGGSVTAQPSPGITDGAG